MAMTLDDVSKKVADNLVKADADMELLLNPIQNGGGAMTPRDLVILQTAFVKYSVALSANTAVIKELGDCFKGVCQKMT